MTKDLKAAFKKWWLNDCSHSADFQSFQAGAKHILELVESENQNDTTN